MTTIKSDWEDFIDSLDDEVIDTGDTGPARKTYPCGQCAGTGKWSGGTNRYGNDKCLACQGRGYFVTSPEFRAKSRAKV